MEVERPRHCLGGVLKIMMLSYKRQSSEACRALFVVSQSVGGLGEDHHLNHTGGFYAPVLALVGYLHGWQKPYVCTVYVHVEQGRDALPQTIFLAVTYQATPPFQDRAGVLWS